MLRAVRDLAALAALSADWIGGHPLQVAQGLVDLLLKTLRLDFAYLRLKSGQVDGHELEVARASRQPTTEAQTREIGQALAPWLDRAGPSEVRSVTNPLGTGTVRVIVVPIGHDGEEGVLVAGSQQAGFPGREERLLLSAVAKPAATALQYRRAEEALEESRRRFRAVFENSLDGILLRDDGGRYVDGNRAICQLLGYSREELLRLTVWDVTPAPNRERIPELMARFLAAGTMSGEYTLLCKDGTTREIEYRSVANVLPGLHLGVHRDITGRKQAERALQYRHDLLQAVIEGIPEAIYVKDLQGRYLLMNSKGARLVGRALEEVIGRDDSALFDSETAQRIREIDRRVMESEWTAAHEQVGTAAGVTRTYLTSKAPYRSADGEVVGVLGISRDITESKSLQTERDRLLERLRLQIDRLPLAYILMDKNHHVLDWNPAAEKMFGYAKVEALGRLCLDLILRDPIDHEILEVIRRVESGDMHADSVNENVTKDGRTITCHWFNTPLMDPDGNLTGIISLAQDISERRRVERESRILQAALENAVEGIARLDRQGRYISVNRAYAEMLGYHPEELIGMDWRSTIHPNDLEKVEAAQRRMLSEGRAEVEILGVRKDDSVFWRNTVMVNTHNHQGQSIGHYSFMKDITERKRAAEALRDSAERLQVLSRQLLELQEAERRHLARELHDEVGQTLTGLRLLLKPTADLPGDVVKTRFEQARGIVDDLLAKVRRLSFDLRPVALDHLGLLPALLALFERYTDQTGVLVNFSHEGVDQRVPPEVETSAYRIVQEALTNAARHASISTVSVRVWATAEMLSLQIEDRGRGFDPDVALATPGSRGLAGMQERVRLLDGHLTVESSPGAGTQLTTELPLRGQSGRQSDDQIHRVGG